MIPKVIHYCWFGGNPIPEKDLICMESWRQHCPEYEIIRWDETNYDVRKHPYMQGAYDAGKWAFVSDYARHDIICEHGGIYLDTDVELLRPLDDLLDQGAFMAFESPENVASGLVLAGEAGHEGLRAMFDEMFAGRSYLKEDGTADLTAIPVLNTAFLCKHGLRKDNSLQTIAGIRVYPTEYFCPKSLNTDKIILTENTYSIHHFNASWLSKRSQNWHRLNASMKAAGGWKEKLAYYGLWRFMGRIYYDGPAEAIRYVWQHLFGRT